MKVICFLFFAVLALASAEEVFQDAKKGQFPYQVSIRSKNKRTHQCGGAILTDRFVLTAGHCILDTREGLDMYIVVGTLHTSPIYAAEGVEIAVDRPFFYGSYRKDLDYCQEAYAQNTYESDIALVRTAEKILFSDVVQPIALPSSDKSYADVMISGWEFAKDELVFMKTQTMDRQICSEQVVDSFMFYKGLREFHICTNKSLNRGLEGGPLVDISNSGKHELLGIASYGVMCKSDYPEVYVKVFPMLKWILDITERFQ